MPKFRLGKKAPRFDKRTLRFGRYLTTAVPAPPPAVTGYQQVATWPMAGNDTIGDCTMAGASHLVEDWTSQASGSEDAIPDATVEADYYQLTGGPDSGLDLLTVLGWWQKTGFVDAAGTAHPITAYAQLEPGNDTELEDAVSLFGGAYVGVALPDFAVNPPDGNLLDVPWTVPANGVSANPPDPNNGHCIVIVGYDQRNYYAVTWGAVKAMSPGFYDAYVDEAYAVISPDWMPRGTSPAGFDLAQLQADLAAVTGGPAPKT